MRKLKAHEYVHWAAHKPDLDNSTLISIATQHNQTDGDTAAGATAFACANSLSALRSAACLRGKRGTTQPAEGPRRARTVLRGRPVSELTRRRRCENGVRADRTLVNTSACRLAHDSHRSAHGQTDAVAPENGRRRLRNSLSLSDDPFLNFAPAPWAWSALDGYFSRGPRRRRNRKTKGKVKKAYAKDWCGKVWAVAPAVA
ncbi:unnamed protein product, partial [Iphiclides podalirius]